MKITIYQAILLFTLMLYYNLAQAKIYTVTLAGEITKTISAKEITIWYWEDLLDKRDPGQELKTVKAKIINGKFKVIIYPQKPNIYMNFGWQSNNRGNVNQLSSYLFIAETNDNVFIKIDSTDSKYNLEFSGPGSAKYNCAIELSNAYKNFKPTNLIVRDNKHISEFNYQKNYHYELINEGKKILEKYKDNISNYSFELYKTDLMYNILNSYIQQLSRLYQYRANKENNLQSLVLAEVNWISNLREKSNESFNVKALETSAFLPAAFVNMATLEAKFKGGLTEEILVNEKNTVIRDRTLAQYFVRISKSLYPDAKEKLYSQISKIVKDPYSKTSIESYYKNTVIGTKAYNFQLPDINGKIVRLSDFKGKIVFIDFWFVGCGGCSHYYENTVKHVEQKYRNSEEVVFISVSINEDLDRWMNAVKSGKYTSEEIINLHCPDGARNPIIKQLAITGYPHPLIIGRDGNIFNDSTKELLRDGIEGLVNALEKALNKNEVRTAVKPF